MNVADCLRAATADMSAALFLLSCLRCTTLITRVACLDDDKLARLQKHLHEYPARPRLSDFALTDSGIEATLRHFRGTTEPA